MSRQLPSEVPQHTEHGQRWHAAGLCVICGKKKEQPEPHHCDTCYSRIYASIFDYDDD